MPRYDLANISLRSITTISVGQAQAIANIKSALNQNRAVWFGFFLPSFTPFYHFWGSQNESAVWNGFSNCGQTWSTFPGHAVLCVGYDDTNPSNRYWIMVNSWGTTAGRPNSIFRVAMNLNYDCQFTISGGGTYPSLYWQTLDVQFAGPELHPEIAVYLGGAPLIDGQTAPVDFGTATPGQSGPTRTFTVRNEGTASLELGAVSVPPGFTVTETLWGLLTPGEQDTFTVRLDTAVDGPKSGRISILNNDSDENPFDFPIAGTVIVPQAEIEVRLGAALITDGQTTPIDFGKVIQGQTGPVKTFTVRNVGGQTLMILGTVSVPTDYTLVKGLPSSIAPDQQDTFTVSLQTTVAGTKTGQISFANSDSDENPFNFPITGVVSAPPTLVYVDASSTCPSPDGSQACPFKTVCDGYDTVATCGTVRIRAGSYTVCRSLLNKCGVFESYGGPVLLTKQGTTSLAGKSDVGSNSPVSATASVIQRANGSFAIQLKCVPGQRYQVFSSMDLVTWELWHDFTPDEELVEFADHDGPSTPMRFFKVVGPIDSTKTAVPFE